MNDEFEPSDAFNRHGMLAALFWGFLLVGIIWGLIVGSSLIWDARWPEERPGFIIPENALYDLGFTDEPHNEVSSREINTIQAWENFITIGMIASFLMIRNWVMVWNTRDWHDWMVISTVAIEMCFMLLYYYVVLSTLWPEGFGELEWIRESVRYILVANLIFGSAIFVHDDIRRWHDVRAHNRRVAG